VETPTEVAEQLVRALGAKNAEAVASMLDPESLDVLVQEARRQGFEVFGPVEAARHVYGGIVGDVLGEVEIESVDVQGTEARVTYVHPRYGRDQDDVLVLRNVGDRWLVHLDAAPMTERDPAQMSERDPLEDAFFAAVDPAIVAAGWTSSMLAPYELLPRRGRYFRRSDALLVPVTQLSSVNAGERPLFVEVTVGVTCPHAERMLSMLRATLCNLTVEEYKGVEAGPWELPLARAADVQRAVRESTRLVAEHWQAISRSINDLDALIDGLRCLGDEDQTDGVQVPAILAAGGRIEDARASLRSYRREYHDPEFDAWAVDFERYLDAGATVPPPSADAFPARE
jgi:hypothetical protein